MFALQRKEVCGAVVFALASAAAAGERFAFQLPRSLALSVPFGREGRLKGGGRSCCGTAQQRLRVHLSRARFTGRGSHPLVGQLV